MSHPRRTITLGFLAALVTSVACGSLGPPASCGENIGGSPDPSTFAQHFASMKLVNADTGVAGPPDSESEASFGQGETLAIQYSAVSPGSLRACVQERTGGGGIPFDQTHAFASGDGTMSLRSFGPGTYVVRAIVGDMLVRNLTFTIK